MNNFYFALDGAWKVFLASLLLGAGLPSLFAVGVRALAYGQGGDAEVSHEGPHPVGKVLAVICFGLVLLGILAGLLVIITSGLGYTMTFDHVIPVFKKK